MHIGMPWIFWTGAALTGPGALVAGWALFADAAMHRRRADRRRCPHCWYDMAATPGLQCPECGRTSSTERRLHRARRRWFSAAIGALALGVGAAGLFNASIAHLDWVPLTPSWLLIRLVDDPGDIDTALSEARYSRAQYSMPMPARPIPPWRERVKSAIWVRYEHGDLSISQRRAVWTSRFRATGAPIAVTTRPRWPEQTPVWIAVNTTTNGPFPIDLRISSGLPGSRPLVIHCGAALSRFDRPSPGRLMDSMGIPPSDSKSLALRVELLESGQLLWEGGISVPVTIAGTPDEVLPPISTPEALSYVRAAMSHAYLSAHAGTLDLPEPVTDDRTITFALEIEFRRGGHAVARCEGVPDTFPTVFSTPSSFTWWTISGDTEVLAAADHADAAWTCHVTGSRDLALRKFDSISYWAGEFDCTLPKPISP
jgi:hypothetical protein